MRAQVIAAGHALISVVEEGKSEPREEALWSPPFFAFREKTWSAP